MCRCRKGETSIVLQPSTFLLFKVNNVTQWHYKQRCHNPCYLPGIPKEMIGDPGLISCAAMSHGKCTLCGCPWQIHMHIYKETKKINVHKEDQSVKNAIKNKEEIRVHIEKLMKDLNKRRSELEGESQTISRSIAKFSYFLQEHALTPFNDAYSDYLKQLIKKYTIVYALTTTNTVFSVKSI